MTDKCDYFISFTKTDKNWADWIAWELNRKRYTFNFQCYDFVPGGNFLRKMNDALKHSSQIISIWSEDYFKSRYATWELEAAHASTDDNKVRVIPVLVKKCNIEPLYKPFIYIDLINKSKLQAKKLLAEGLEAGRIGKYNSKIKKRVPFPGEKIPSEKPETHRSEIAGPLRILYTGCEDASQLDLSGQRNIIKKVVSGLEKRKKLKFYSKLDLSIQNIFETIEKINPHILHFAGKQDGGNILIESKKGAVTTITEKQLSGLFRSMGENLKLVIIDTCFSFSAAKHVSGVVDFTLGVKGDIYDEDAIAFYERFYKALCTGKSLADAVEQARVQSSMNRVRVPNIPTLFSKRGADPSQFRITES